jgi:hypothetical protein
MKLYELPTLARMIDELIEDADGEITPDIAAMLDEMEGTLASKVDGIGALIREHTFRAAAFAEEMARLKERKATQERAAERLKAYLQGVMQKLGVDRVVGGRYSATLQRAGRPAIAWAGDPDRIPAGFRRETVAPDLAAAQDAYAAGVLPEGFTATFTTSLRLR